MDMGMMGGCMMSIMSPDQQQQFLDITRDLRYQMLNSGFPTWKPCGIPRQHRPTWRRSRQDARYSQADDDKAGNAAEQEN